MQVFQNEDVSNFFYTSDQPNKQIQPIYILEKLTDRSEVAHQEMALTKKGKKAEPEKIILSMIVALQQLNATHTTEHV